MAYMARGYGVNMSLIEATIKGNDARKTEMAERILAAVKGIENPVIGVLGLAFKGGTDDCRESPAMDIIAELLKHNVKIRAYDPKAMETAKALVADKLEYASDAYDAANGADVLAVLTEWEDFKSLDLARLKQALKAPKIVDLRNLIDKSSAQAQGFEYTGIGH